MKEDVARFRFGDAARAMRALLKDPDDTAQVFRIIEALSGNHGDKMLKRLRASRTGARLLEERPNLAARLCDRAALEKLPDGTLGREYLRFLDSEGISAEGLVKASVEGTTLYGTAELEFFRDRMRDSHDLWHVLTGYKGDLVGEAALLAFSFAQTKNPGVGFIISIGFLRGGANRGAQRRPGPPPQVRRMILEGFRHGTRAEWLPAVEWEKLLEHRVEDVRKLLGIEKIGHYEEVRSKDYKAAMAA